MNLWKMELIHLFRSWRGWTLLGTFILTSVLSVVVGIFIERSSGLAYTDALDLYMIASIVGTLLFSAGTAWATSRDAVDEGARFEKYISKAENGDVDAQVTLGMMYDNGWYVAENKAEAFKWFLRAAEQGDVKSQMSVGWEYGSGKLFPKIF